MYTQFFKKRWNLVGLMPIIILASLLWLSCGKEPQPPITAPTPATSESAGLSKTSDNLNEVMAIQERHTAELMAINGVVGTAVCARADGGYAVAVLTSVGGKESYMPTSLEGVPCVVENVGEINTLAFTGRFRPVPIGVSTGNINECSAGTIGCGVSRGDDHFYLSNNHVFARSNAAAMGEFIVQPGRFDRACAIVPTDIIGALADFQVIIPGFILPAPNVMDAAIAKIRPGVDATCRTLAGCYGRPNSDPVAAALGMIVKKCGRTTMQTRGTIVFLNATVLVGGYPFGVATFRQQIIILGAGFSRPGDSGSLIVTDDGERPVALLFAGSSIITVGNPIHAVLQRFRVRICGDD